MTTPGPGPLAQITNRLKTIMESINVNNTFIGQIRERLSGISKKLDELVDLREQLMGEVKGNTASVAQMDQQIEALTTERNDALKNGDLSKKQLAELQLELREVIRLRDDAVTKSQGLQNQLNGLDEQIQQIAQLVATQTRVLDLANSGEDSNIFHYINDITNKLNNALPKPPAATTGGRKHKRRTATKHMKKGGYYASYKRRPSTRSINSRRSK